MRYIPTIELSIHFIQLSLTFYIDHHINNLYVYVFTYDSVY